MLACWSSLVLGRRRDGQATGASATITGVSTSATSYRRTRKRSQRDAELMILLQDWASDDVLSGPYLHVRCTVGHDPDRGTNKRLQRSVVSAFWAEARTGLCDERFPVRQGRFDARLNTEARSRACRAGVRATSNPDCWAPAGGVPGQGSVQRRGGRSRPASGQVAGRCDRVSVRHRQDPGLVPGPHRAAGYELPKSDWSRSGLERLGTHGVGL